MGRSEKNDIRTLANLNGTNDMSRSAAFAKFIEDMRKSSSKDSLLGTQCIWNLS